MLLINQLRLLAIALALQGRSLGGSRCEGEQAPQERKVSSNTFETRLPHILCSLESECDILQSNLSIYAHFMDECLWGLLPNVSSRRCGGCSSRALHRAGRERRAPLDAPTPSAVRQAPAGRLHCSTEAAGGVPQDRAQEAAGAHGLPNSCQSRFHNVVLPLSTWRPWEVRREWQVLPMQAR